MYLHLEVSISKRGITRTMAGILSANPLLQASFVIICNLQSVKRHPWTFTCPYRISCRCPPGSFLRIAGKRPPRRTRRIPTRKHWGRAELTGRKFLEVSKIIDMHLDMGVIQQGAMDTDVESTQLLRLAL